jgi:hypothetical protein
MVAVAWLRYFLASHRQREAHLDLELQPCRIFRYSSPLKHPRGSHHEELLSLRRSCLGTSWICVQRASGKKLSICGGRADPGIATKGLRRVRGTARLIRTTPKQESLRRYAVPTPFDIHVPQILGSDPTHSMDMGDAGKVAVSP